MSAQPLPTRPLGNTGLDLPILSFGASSLGAEFRNVQMDEVFASVRVALECGMNLIDTSPYYGRGMSEVLLGVALQNVPREEYQLCTKLGRFDVNHFDYSAKRVAESIDVSLHRLRTDHLDIVLCHDIEFVSLGQIVEETLPALRKAKQAGKVRCIGISGYPMKMFTEMSEQTELDCIMSYNQYTLQNTRLVDDVLPKLKPKGVGIMNAGPFAARLLTNATLPSWHKDSAEVQQTARKAAELCESRGVDIAKLALQFSCSHPDLATTVAGSANPDNIRKWAQWINEPIDQELLADVLAVFQPVHNISHAEGLPENN
ncbi:aldo/keto reductase [Allorhodopirellula heiligendammensis]|uniref:D-threo-aldose 1-dehydrogenase n=1 Tax=Allorhodopirellula heiligendammensis TaxID=2714739 RepID=A0A5C6BGI1_9BACT|nr:aldo/keto reductase [Allorhodopirellula heiligendammensis]TWU10406.1 D-threo-aldose 1-dehydrogenase [Allorhodopirellula heiligendammensis]